MLLHVSFSAPSWDGNVMCIFDQTPPTAPPAPCPLGPHAWRHKPRLEVAVSSRLVDSDILSGRCAPWGDALRHADPGRWILTHQRSTSLPASELRPRCLLLGPQALLPFLLTAGKPCPHLAVCLAVCPHRGHTGTALLCGLGSRRSSPGFRGSLRLLLGSQQPRLFLFCFFKS